MKKIILLAVLALSYALATPLVADTNPSTVNATIRNPLKGDISTIPDLLKAIINDILIPIGSVVAVVAFIWAGFLFVTAQGNESKLETAKRALLYTAIGTAILLGAWVLTNVLTGTLNALRT